MRRIVKLCVSSYLELVEDKFMTQDKRKVKNVIMIIFVFLVMIVASLYVIGLWVHDSKLRQEPLKVEQLPR